jgi:hypothetical protein
VPRVRDLLYRFRPAGAPGPASAAAVPVDRAGDRAEELAPVLELLVETEDRCSALDGESARDARERREQARQAAHHRLADAESRAQGERADAAAGVAARAAGERARTVESARAEADRLLAQAEERTPEWVDRVVAEVEDRLDPAPQGNRR